MKNISRRVFIKGLAVAGVAAAASTVLAGCNTNMIPGVDEPTEEPTTTTQTLTFADPEDKDKTVSITLSDLKIDNTITSGLILKLSAKVVNDAESSIFFTPLAYASGATKVNNNDYYVVIKAYPDDRAGNNAIGYVIGNDCLITSTEVNENLTAFNVASATSGTVTEEGYLYLLIGDEDLEWNKLTVELDVQKVLTKGANFALQPVKTLKYTFNK